MIKSIIKRGKLFIFLLCGVALLIITTSLRTEVPFARVLNFRALTFVDVQSKFSEPLTSKLNVRSEQPKAWLSKSRVSSEPLARDLVHFTVVHPNAVFESMEVRNRALPGGPHNFSRFALTDDTADVRRKLRARPECAFEADFEYGFPRFHCAWGVHVTTVVLLACGEEWRSGQGYMCKVEEGFRMVLDNPHEDTRLASLRWLSIADGDLIFTHRVNGSFTLPQSTAAYGKIVKGSVTANSLIFRCHPCYVS
jgi:hypothetical protein